jgi:outer membrane biosynthesis protein TonB
LEQLVSFADSNKLVALVDFPVFYFFDELHAAFPDAAILVSTRNASEWARKRQPHNLVCREAVAASATHPVVKSPALPHAFALVPCLERQLARGRPAGDAFVRISDLQGNETGLARLAAAFDIYNRHVRRAAKEKAAPYAEVNVVDGNTTAAHVAVEQALHMQLKFEPDTEDLEDGEEESGEGKKAKDSEAQTAKATVKQKEKETPKEKEASKKKQTSKEKETAKGKDTAKVKEAEKNKDKDKDADKATAPQRSHKRRVDTQAKTEPEDAENSSGSLLDVVGAAPNVADTKKSDTTVTAADASTSSPLPMSSDISADLLAPVPTAGETLGCVAVVGQRAADDKWCAQSCGNVPPNCPPALCTCPSGNPTAGFQHEHKVTEDLAFMDKLMDSTSARLARKVGDYE